MSKVVTLFIFAFYHLSCSAAHAIDIPDFNYLIENFGEVEVDSCNNEASLVSDEDLAQLCMVEICGPANSFDNARDIYRKERNKDRYTEFNKVQPIIKKKIAKLAYDFNSSLGNTIKELETLDSGKNVFSNIDNLSVMIYQFVDAYKKKIVKIDFRNKAFRFKDIESKVKYPLVEALSADSKLTSLFFDTIFYSEEFLKKHYDNRSLGNVLTGELPKLKHKLQKLLNENPKSYLIQEQLKDVGKLNERYKSKTLNANSVEQFAEITFMNALIDERISLINSKTKGTLEKYLKNKIPRLKEIKKSLSEELSDGSITDIADFCADIYTYSTGIEEADTKKISKLVANTIKKSKLVIGASFSNRTATKLNSILDDLVISPPETNETIKDKFWDSIDDNSVDNTNLKGVSILRDTFQADLIDDDFVSEMKEDCKQNMRASLSDSMTNSDFGILNISWVAARSPFLKQIMAHEIGHTVENNLSSGKLSVESTTHFNDISNCLNNNHGGVKKYRDEDFADSFSTKVATGKKNTACFIQSKHSFGYFSPSLVNTNKKDTHSAELFRAVLIEKGQDKTLPPHCSSLLKSTGTFINKCF